MGMQSVASAVPQLNFVSHDNSIYHSCACLFGNIRLGSWNPKAKHISCLGHSWFRTHHASIGIDNAALDGDEFLSHMHPFFLAFLYNSSAAVGQALPWSWAAMFWGLIRKSPW